MTGRVLRVAGIATMCVWLASLARAQAPAPAPPAPMNPLTGSAGFGLSLTQGNSDTLNLSVTADAVYDPKTKNVMKGNVLYLRNTQNSVLAVNRVSGAFRDEYTVSGRTFLFGQVDALHDTFKAIDYLVAPTAGVGYKAIDTKRSQLAVDAGVGAVIEQDTGKASSTSGAITLSEKLAHQLTDSTTVKQSVTALLKTNNFSDGLYTFQAGIAAKINSRLQLAVDVLDTFKSQPIDPTLKKNDVALVTSIVAKY